MAGGLSPSSAPEGLVKLTCRIVSEQKNGKDEKGAVSEASIARGLVSFHTPWATRFTVWFTPVFLWACSGPESETTPFPRLSSETVFSVDLMEGKRPEVFGEVEDVAVDMPCTNSLRRGKSSTLSPMSLRPFDRRSVIGGRSSSGWRPDLLMVQLVDAGWDYREVTPETRLIRVSTGEQEDSPDSL